MVVGVPKETAPGERRVAMVPDVVKRLAAKDVEVVVEAGAGEAALIPDALFEEAGAKIGDPWSADVVVKVTAPSQEELGKLSDDAVLVGFLAPLTSPETTRALADAGATAFAMEAIPRISRAQSMDALSSQSNVAGYKAALLGAEHATRFYPMLTTAAGTIPPAKVLVLGGGVAGLQALATAKRLGARTTGYDVRPEVAEQVQSLGANWLDLGIEAVGEGGYARELTEEEQAQQKQALTDLAGEAGGNCELTEPGEVVVKSDVTIVSPLNLPTTMPEHASQLYARNVQALIELMLDDEGNLNLDFEDEIIAGACVVRDGEIVHEGAKKTVEGAAA
jgi:NAD(P) transhydrogenase subunit alpha